MSGREDSLKMLQQPREAERLALFGTCFGVNLRLTESSPKEPRLGRIEGVSVKRPAIFVLCSI